MNCVWTLATKTASTLSRRPGPRTRLFNDQITSLERALSSYARTPSRSTASSSRRCSPLSWQLACRARSQPVRDLTRSAGNQARSASKVPDAPDRKSEPAVPKPQRGSIPEENLLPGQPFESAEIKAIFDNDALVSTELGNFIIATIHLRRQRGSLVELGVRPYNKRRAWTDSAGNKALAWLREHHPLDEGLAAAVFAENEARRIEEELNIKKALKWGLYKPRDDTGGQANGRRVKDAPSKAEEIYGKSMLQEMREKNEARHKAELERLAKEREALRERERLRRVQKYVNKAQLEGKTVKDLVASGDIKDVVVPRQYRGRDLSQYEKDAMITTSEAPPKLSEFERLFNPTIFAILALCGCALLAYYYTPPDKAHRLFPSLEPGVATCLAIAGINTAIFLIWRFPPAWRIMNRYFQLSPGYPFAFSIVGNAFSHLTPSHLAMNMVWMFGAGVHLHDMIGRGNFIALYIGSAAFSSWCSLVFHAAAGMLTASTVGASGPVLAIISALLWLKEDLGTWRIPFSDITLDLNGHYALGALACVELAVVAGVLLRLTPYKYDHAVHIAGMLVGVAGAKVLQAQAVVKQGSRIDLNKPFAGRSDDGSGTGSSSGGAVEGEGKR